MKLNRRYASLRFQRGESILSLAETYDTSTIRIEEALRSYWKETAEIKAFSKKVKRRNRAEFEKMSGHRSPCRFPTFACSCFGL